MKKNGFTLFEVLIAMALMSSAAVLLVVAWGGNQVRVRKMAVNNQAAFLLDQMMSELEIKYRRRILQLPESEEGSFEDNPNFTWAMKSRDFEMPDLRSLLPPGDNDDLMLMVIDKLTEYLNESVKEMTVTVTYTRGKSKVKYSATTFMVDYDRPLPLGIPSGGIPGLGQ
ncbi:MAG: type II secretion system GspH family protein [Bdellovibrionales bacterium]|nr:type II secretion system GspH family protein [Bdellovibrionales bacterium]